MKKQETQEFILNNFRTKNFKDKILVITEQGDWIALSKKRFDLLMQGKPDKETIESGLIINKNNINNIVKKQRAHYTHLYSGVSLHIVSLTSRCNLKCSYCHSEVKAENFKNVDMDKNTAKKVVDFIFKSSSDYIRIEFQGGEPLLNFSALKEIVNYANKLNKTKKKKLSFALVNNLTKMNDKIIDYLIKNNIGICTSLDGPKDVHDKIRTYFNGKGSYKDVVKWINKIKNSKNYSLEALMVTTKFSLAFPIEIVDEYVKHGFRRIQIKQLSNLGSAHKSWEEISYSAEEFLDFWKKCVDYMVELNLKGTYINEVMTTYILKNILTDEPNAYVDLQSPCGAALNQLAYDYTGSVYTCDEGRQFDLFKLGDFTKDEYKDVLTSEGAASIIAASTNDCYLCDNCVYKPYCGICPVLNYSESGNLLPKLAANDRCKILKGMFDYIFERLLNSRKYEKVFKTWANQNPK